MSEAPGITVMTLAPALDPPMAEELLRQLKAARNTALVVEAGAVARVSTLAIQALLAGWLTWKTDGHDFHIASASAAFTDAAALLGLPPEFLGNQVEAA